ncbi:MAG: TRAP transporter small permease subunit [Hyphomicrobiaceae bacterium]
MSRAEGDAFSRLKSVIVFIEWINETIGRAVSMLALPLVLVTCAVAVLRYGFSMGWVWMQELYIWTHAVIFLVASGYTLLQEGHVRIDVIYGPASLRTKAWINIIGTLFFLLPMIGLIAYVALPYVALSWSRLETSQEAGGLSGLFLLKSCMLVFAALLALQGLALFLRSILVLAGEAEWTAGASQTAGEH